MAFVSKADAAVPPPSAAQLLAEAWQYGWGAFDEKTKRVRTFVPFSHFTGSAWQTSPAMPDPRTGWAMINADGGHPGNDQEHAAIRRWIAPANGAVHVEGTLKVTEAGGDGIRANSIEPEWSGW